MYDAVLGAKTQKLLVMTKSLTNEQLQEEVNSKCYELEPLRDVENLTELIDRR